MLHITPEAMRELQATVQDPEQEVIRLFIVGSG